MGKTKVSHRRLIERGLWKNQELS